MAEAKKVPFSMSGPRRQVRDAAGNTISRQELFRRMDMDELAGASNWKDKTAEYYRRENEKTRLLNGYYAGTMDAKTVADALLEHEKWYKDNRQWFEAPGYRDGINWWGWLFGQGGSMNGPAKTTGGGRNGQ